jgi:hypothetical protein
MQNEDFKNQDYDDATEICREESRTGSATILGGAVSVQPLPTNGRPYLRQAQKGWVPVGEVRQKPIGSPRKLTARFPRVRTW